ncbi:hypothetical protein Scep_025634 [Stephania cephalantha]|uniref:Uncharacterized protein n=1 Tax=Stephania cephalantha TaxID=152367 RepID=A0AAP0EIK0_9MAGN
MGVRLVLPHLEGRYIIESTVRKIDWLVLDWFDIEKEVVSMENDDESEYSTEDDSKQDSEFDGEEENIMEEDRESSSE